MPARFSWLFCVLVSTALCLPVQQARGQEYLGHGNADPGEATEVDESSSETGTPLDPLTAKATSKKRKAADKAKPRRSVLDQVAIESTLRAILKDSTDPAVQAILFSQPQAPKELLRVIQRLIEIERRDLAKQIIDAIDRQGWEPAALQEAQLTASAGLLAKLDVLPEFQPAGARLARQIDSAFADLPRETYWSNRVDRLLDRPGISAAALSNLGSAAIPRLLERILNPAAESNQEPAPQELAARERRVCQQALAHLARAETSASLAYMDPADAAEFTQLLSALGQGKAVAARTQVLAWWLDPALPTVLKERCRATLGRWQPNPPTETEGLAELEQALAAGWAELKDLSQRERTVPHWVRTGRLLAKHESTRRVVLVNTLSRWAIPLASDTTRRASPAAIRGALAALESQAERADQGTPPSAQQAFWTEYLSALSPGELVELLDEGLQTKLYGASRLLCEQLAGRGNADLLYTSPGAPSAVVKACADSDPRVQLAAVECIVKWQPELPFAGREQVERTLEYLAEARGQTVVVGYFPAAAHVSQEIAPLRAKLNAASLELRTTNSLDDLLRAAFANPDVIALFLYMDEPLGDSQAVVEELRTDSRSAHCQLVLVAPAELVPQLRERYRGTPRVIVWNGSTKAASMEKLVSKLAAVNATVGANSKNRQVWGETARSSWKTWQKLPTAGMDPFVRPVPFAAAVSSPEHPVTAGPDLPTVVESKSAGATSPVAAVPVDAPVPAADSVAPAIATPLIGAPFPQFEQVTAAPAPAESTSDQPTLATTETLQETDASAESANTDVPTVETDVDESASQLSSEADLAEEPQADEGMESAAPDLQAAAEEEASGEETTELEEEPVTTDKADDEESFEQASADDETSEDMEVDPATLAEEPSEASATEDIELDEAPDSEEIETDTTETTDTEDTTETADQELEAIDTPEEDPTDDDQEDSPANAAEEPGAEDEAEAELEEDAEEDPEAADLLEEVPAEPLPEESARVANGQLGEGST